ncbi:hypothetical protein [Mycobacterium sp. OTB74]|uniref:hypothetical protein n=1 Tax=Mycobacterium sp. OTB74 TaxID=1853452 RepID=UPI0024748034|nr:hypothetical protein [Mycobacterium sp. OTB74]
MSPAPAIPMPTPPLASAPRAVAPYTPDLTPHTRPVALTDPTLSPPVSPAAPQPDMRPPTPTGEQHELVSFTTRFTEPRTVAPELVPVRREPPRPCVTPAPPVAQVSIGTIEVVVTPPQPVQSPAPTVHQPVRPMAPTLPGRAGTDVARRQARRWYGAGQS